jgi:mannose-6-phosphate isomerase-like protein (cupin superfamily)
MKTMVNIRAAALVALAAACIGALWHSQIIAQEKSPVGVVTVFDHEKLNASFAKAVSNGGSNLLWSHTSGKETYNVQTHSRESVNAACKPEGCSHTGYTAVVYVVSGAATMVVAGSAKTTAPDKFGGQFIQGGESRRISKGDVFIMPPDTFHWYKNIEPPFQYLEVPVP